MLSGQVAPLSGLLDGRPDGQFEDFFGAVIGPTGLVAFEGSVRYSPDDNDPETPEGRAAIWVVDSLTGQLRMVMISGMPAPGTAGTFTSGFSELRIDSLGNVLFDSSGPALAYYHASPANSLTQILRQSQPVPGAPGLTFGDVRLGTGIINNGHIAINEPVEGSATGRAAVRWDGATLSTIIYPGMAVPSAPAGTTFGSATAYVSSGGSHLVITSTRLNTTVTPGFWRHEAGVLTPIVQVNDPMPGFPFFAPRFTTLESADINNAGQVAFSGSGIDGSFDFSAIYRTGPTGWTRVVSRGDDAPGTPSDFFVFQTVAINGEGHIAFLGSTGVSGLWLARPDATQTTFGITHVAVVNQPALDPLLPAGAVFTGLTNAFNFNSLDQLAFLAKIGGTGINTTNDDTLWFYDPVDGLKLIARENGLFTVAPGDLRTVRTIEFVSSGGGGQDGRPSSLSDLGLLTFSLAFTNNSNGLFVYGPPPTGDDFYWRSGAFSNNWHGLLSGNSNWEDDLSNIHALAPGAGGIENVFVEVPPANGIVLDQQNASIGSIQFPSGTLTLRKKLELDAPSVLDDLVLDGIESAMVVNSTLTVTGDVDWKQGVISGDLAVGRITLAATASLETTDDGNDLAVHTLAVDMVTRGIFRNTALLGLDAVLTVAPGSILFLERGAIAGTGLVTVEGALRKPPAAAPNHIEIFVPLHVNAGKIVVDQGTLTLTKAGIFDGATIELEAGTVLQFLLDAGKTTSIVGPGALVARGSHPLANSPTGSIHLLSGNFTVDSFSGAIFELQGDGLRLEGGVLGGTGPINNKGDMLWSGGRIENNAATFRNEGRLRVAQLDGQSIELRGRLRNAGTLTQGSAGNVLGGLFTLNGATITNEGQWNFLGGVFLLAGGPSIFSNDGGELNIHVETSLALPFRNRLGGRLRVHGVPLKLTQGASHVDSGDFILIPGASAASLTITGPQTFDGIHEIRGDGSFSMLDTTLTIASGQLTYNLLLNPLPAFDNITLSGGGTLRVVAPVELRKIIVDGGHVQNEKSHIRLLGETLIQNDGDIKNDGIMEIEDVVTLQTGAKFQNLAGGVLKIDTSNPTPLDMSIAATETGGSSRFINAGGRIEVDGPGNSVMVFDLPVDFAGGSIEALDPIVHFLRDLNVTAPATFSTRDGHISIGGTKQSDVTNSRFIGGTRFDGQGGFLLHFTVADFTGGDVFVDMNGEREFQIRDITTTGPGRLVILSNAAVFDSTIGNLVNRAGISNASHQLRFATNTAAGSTLKDNITNQGHMTLGGFAAAFDPTLRLVNEAGGLLSIETQGLTIHPGAQVSNQGTMRWNKESDASVEGRPLTLSNQGTLVLGSATHLLLESARVAQFGVEGGALAVTGGTWNLQAASRLTVVTGDTAVLPLARSQAALSFQGNGKIDNLAGAFRNQGSFRLLEGSRLVLTGNFTNEGLLVIDGTSSLTTPVFDNDGVLHMHGKLITNLSLGSTSSFTGLGSLFGSGITEGTVAPGNSPGLLTVTENFTFLSTASLEIELAGIAAGEEYDRFAVGQAATLDGELALFLLDGFEAVITPGDSFVVLTAGIIHGEFANAPAGMRLGTRDGLGSFAVDYTPTSLVLTDFQGIPEPSTLAMLTAAAMVGLRRHRQAARSAPWNDVV